MTIVILNAVAALMNAATIFMGAPHPVSVAMLFINAFAAGLWLGFSVLKPAAA